MAGTEWNELSPAWRRASIVSGAFDGAFKLAALVNRARRAAADVSGPEAAWAVATTLVNSVGAIPLPTFACGRGAHPTSFTVL
ncbi:hypothetical protein OHA18_41555 [Kribbella sp. NBC_00709]|uniref:hypothetical protein n=1 Tax=Kribbella sp. NBC_00709 TaxID=2975972 RepID=UPI002E29A258|nr:hypothetical protein [Kribbella sp. NBC_00709]